MFFKKGLRDLSLIRKLTMKNIRMSEELLAIANKYTLAVEGTLDTRDQKKDKDLAHSDLPGTSKNNDKKRKADQSVANVEPLHRNKEYRSRLEKFEGFLDRISIFRNQGKHKTRDYD
jgi:hypothetical protein